METKNIFVVGLDPFHLNQLKTLRKATHYNFYPLFRHDEIRTVDEFPVETFLREATLKLEAFPGTIDAIVGYWDFPVSTLLPLLRKPFGLISPSLETVLKCEHKYWSRLLQSQVIPDHVPRFAYVDPFADEPLTSVDIEYPFWLKPVRGVLSHLGFKIDNETEFRRSIEQIRQRIGRFAEPFNYLLGHAQLPTEIAAVDGYHCIAEAIIAAPIQCTLEGYVHGGEVQIYGVIDSTREGPQASSFTRYYYPSRIPEEVIARMKDLTQRVMEHMGYDNAPFNIEFFWDKQNDQLWLLEINPRISKSHSPLFRTVDGEYHHAVMIDVALGERPDFPYREGRFSCAAKFMVRKYQDARVTRVPTSEEIKRLEKQFDAWIQIQVEEGIHLSELRDQESYSYEVAVIFMGADSEQALEDKYRRCLDALSLEFADTGGHDEDGQ